MTNKTEPEGGKHGTDLLVPKERGHKYWKNKVKGLAKQHAPWTCII